MSRYLNFSSDEYYHCYNKGTEKRKIFIDKKDYDRFNCLLFACNSKKVIHLSDYKNKFSVFDINRGETLVDIGAYCLMPNNFHLLLKEKEDGNISLFMQKLITAYTMYFNKRHKRTGTLFEGRFKAEHVEEDRYLKYIFSYIHLSPLKLINPNWKEKGIKNGKEVLKFLNGYEYSSFLDYTGERSEYYAIIDPKSLPGYFSKVNKFEEEIFDWITYVKVEP